MAKLAASMQSRAKDYNPKVSYYVKDGVIYKANNGTTGGQPEYYQTDRGTVEVKPAQYIDYKMPSGITTKVREDVYPAMMSMVDAAKTQGHDIAPRTPNGVFRTLEKQIEKAATGSNSVAKAGNSAHGTGLAIDFNTSDNFKTNPDYYNNPKAAWLADNAKNHGFYAPKDMYLKSNTQEPWHYEYNKDIDPIVQEQRRVIGQERVETAQPVANLGLAMATNNFSGIGKAVQEIQPDYWGKLSAKNDDYETEVYLDDTVGKLKSGKLKKASNPNVQTARSK